MEEFDLGNLNPDDIQAAIEGLQVNTAQPATETTIETQLKTSNNEDLKNEKTSLRGRNVPPRIKKVHESCKGSEEEESEDESKTDADNEDKN